MKKHGRFLWAYLPALSAVGISGVECFQGALCLKVLLVPWAILSLVMSYLLVRMLINERAKDEFTTRQLLQAQKMATIGEMASGIAHEVNNPLAVIGREVEWIQELVKEHPPADAEATQEIIESLQVIGGQVARCAEFTHRLLNFARKSEPVLQWVDINGLIEDMVRLVERLSKGKDISFQRSYQDPITPLWTDPPLLRQVLLNLLNNAVQAIESQGTVTASSQEHPNGWVDISIADTGCGIPTSHLPHLFDPFFTTKAPSHGTGLGLAVCQKIVTALGGLILVESTVGCGSRFTVRLPRRPHTLGQKLA